MRDSGLVLFLMLLFVSDSLLSPTAAAAQQAGNIPRIGYLTPAPPGALGFDQFRQAMREIGYVDRQNIVLEERSAGGELNRLPHLAAELVRMRVDVIVAVANEAIRAAKDATPTIPVVMRFSSDDSVASGFVSSYAKPGGNVTGLTILAPALGAKRLELLKEVVPGLDRIAVLVNPRRASYQLKETQRGGSIVGDPTPSRRGRESR